MRCPRCGNDNPDGMRFCGMCGGTLLPPSPSPAAKPERSVLAAPQPSAGVTATATRSSPPEQSQRAIQDSPSIAGPSFLGLNDAPVSRKRANLNPHDSGSRNLDYLLHDEEEPRGGGGAGKFFLIVLALLLAVGFGYLRWKNQLPWLTTGAKKPAAATQPADQPPADTSTSAAPGATPEPQPAQNQASNPATANPPAAIQSAPNPTPSSTVTPAPTTPATNSNAQPSAESGTRNDSGNPPESSPTGNTQSDSSATAKSGELPSKSADLNSDESATAAPGPEAAAKPAPAPAKPKAASKPVDSVAQAQKYLYGRGVSQDCDHGLRILKPLANQGDPKAMVEMGALYSAGLCTPRDLPTSYRWFAVALRKDPSNQQIQNDLQKLWGEMTQPERQLAIKLTQ